MSHGGIGRPAVKRREVEDTGFLGNVYVKETYVTAYLDL